MGAPSSSCHLTKSDTMSDMLITAEYDGLPYNPPTGSPLEQSSSLGSRDLTTLGPTPGCINCVSGLRDSSSNDIKSGLTILGVLAIFAIGLTVYSLSRK